MNGTFASVAGWLLLGATCALAQDGVRIVRVPDLLRLPAEAGANVLLEVELTSAADAVWLANEVASRDTIALRPVGNLRFQVNLADPRVAAMLPAGRDRGDLFVFAKAGAKVIESAAVSWSRAANAGSSVRCLVRRKAAATTILPPDQRAWLDPQQLESIELQGVGARQSAAVARVGDLQVPLVHRGERELWVLESSTMLQERLRNCDALEIEVRRGAESIVFAFDLVPSRLTLRDGDAAMVVQQRGRVAIPGSNAWLTVHIDDITMGRVMLDITAADGAIVVAQRLVRERDFVQFALADECYVLTIDRLVNLLIGEDHAEMTVRPAAGFRPDRIGQLIHCVDASDDMFLREGKEYAGSLAAQFLVARVSSPSGRAMTLDEFVDQVASKSSRTGEPYQVRTKAGATVTMQAWLRAELQRLDAAELQPARK